MYKRARRDTLQNVNAPLYTQSPKSSQSDRIMNASTIGKRTISKATDAFQRIVELFDGTVAAELL